MHPDPLFFTLFLIFTGAAVLATGALYAHQALLVTYIVLGILLGPSVLGLVNDPNIIQQIAQIGIIFLLFLLGLNLHPQQLTRSLPPMLAVTGVSSLALLALGAGVAWAFGFAAVEALVIGAAMMFSSTIIGLKLLPATVLHHQRTGERIIAILLLQDLVAIIVLMLLQNRGTGMETTWSIAASFLSLPLLVAFAFLFHRYVLFRLLQRFDTIFEYIFLLSIGWCLGLAQLAAAVGLSTEIGAFVAGVAMAASPISNFIAERLRPLRDFFLVMFFFSLGATLDLTTLTSILLPAGVLTALALALKPLLFAWPLRAIGEPAERATEIGVRLAQVSEFALLIAVLAADQGVIGSRASYLIQVTTVLTFVVSSYVIVARYPTPVATDERLRQD